MTKLSLIGMYAQTQAMTFLSENLSYFFNNTSRIAVE